MTHLTAAQTLKLYWQRSLKPGRVFGLVAPGPSFQLVAWGVRRSHPETVLERTTGTTGWQIVEIEPNDPRV